MEAPVLHPEMHEYPDIQRLLAVGTEFDRCPTPEAACRALGSLRAAWLTMADRAYRNGISATVERNGFAEGLRHCREALAKLPDEDGLALVRAQFDDYAKLHEILVEQGPAAMQKMIRQRLSQRAG